MSNMTHCRFENTALDVQDCIDAVETMLNNKGKDAHGDILSRTEMQAFEEMINLCENFSNYANTLLENYDDEMHETTTYD